MRFWLCFLILLFFDPLRCWFYGWFSKGIGVDGIDVKAWLALISFWRIHFPETNIAMWKWMVGRFRFTVYITFKIWLSLQESYFPEQIKFSQCTNDHSHLDDTWWCQAYMNPSDEWKGKQFHNATDHAWLWPMARKTPCSSSLATMVWHYADCSLGKDFSVSCMIFWKSCQTALLERELTRLGSSDLHRWPGSIAFGYDSLDEPKMPLDPWKDDRWQSTQKSIKNGDLKLLQQNTWESSSLA